MMKIYSMLILFCFLETLLCDVEGVNIDTIKNAFNKALPYMTTFHQSRFNLPDKENTFDEIKLDFEQLNSNNIQFAFDEFGLLHIKFVNLNIKISGNFYYKFIFFKKKLGFSVQLNNFFWEETFALSSTKLPTGKYSIKYKLTGQSDIRFTPFILKIEEDQLKQLADKMIKAQLKNLDFSSFKLHLIKLGKVIFDTLQNN